MSDLGSGGRLSIGLDVGGSKIAGGVVDGDGTIVESLTPFPTPQDQESTLTLLKQAVVELRSRRPLVEAIGVGAAGLIDWPDGFVRWAPNNGYRTMPLRDLLQKETGLPAVVDNDANVAAWAEARVGTSANSMMFVTVGTGIGGGVVLDRQLFRGSTGIGAEIGHIVVDAYGDCACGCGNVGCLEAVASGTALGRYGREAATADPDGMLATLAGAPAAVTGQTVFEAALADDATAHSLYARIGTWLGIGMASLTNVFDFDLIVVGGGVAAAGDLLLDPARAGLSKHIFAGEHRSTPRIVPSVLGVEAGWVGAALLALDTAG